MSLVIGIISYLPNDLDKRRVRLRQHQEQLAWLSRIIPGRPMIVIAQNYEDFEDEECKGFYPHESIRFAKGIGPAEARDKLLEKFYASSYDHLLILDDDATAYPYYECEKVFQEVDEHPEKFLGIDAFCSQHPRYLPFKERIYNDKRNLTDWKFTKRPPNTGAQIAVLRNIWKDYHKAVFHQKGCMDELKEGETDFSKVASEDVAFHLDWIKAGLSYYTLETLQVKESTTNSVIFSDNTDERVAQEKQLIANFVERNKHVGLEVKNGRVNWSKVFGYYDKTKPVKYIYREQKMELFPENVIPKKLAQQKETKKRLF